MTALAADWTGYIIDEKCSTDKKMWGNEKCANVCLGKGEKLVFVTPDDGSEEREPSNQDVSRSEGHRCLYTCALAACTPPPNHRSVACMDQAGDALQRRTPSEERHAHTNR